jgi:hypothetical protein
MTAEDFLKLATPTIAGNMITLELGENTLQQLVRDIAIQPR